MKIIIAGGSGYLGELLVKHFKSVFNAPDIIILSRRSAAKKEGVAYVAWDAKTIGAWTACLEGAQVLINLTGKNINCRYSDKNKEEILRSRIDSTRVLGEAMSSLKNPPELWINASSATMYRDRGDFAHDEQSEDFGEGFLETVAVEWEREFDKWALPGVRKIKARIGVVMGQHPDSALKYLNLAAKTGMGGGMAGGKQYMNWISEYDIVRIFEFFIREKAISGPVNICDPMALTNKAFFSKLCQHYHIPFGFPIPKLFLMIGTFLLGTEPELVLNGRNVTPSKLLEHGFTFGGFDTIF